MITPSDKIQSFMKRVYGDRYPAIIDLNDYDCPIAHACRVANTVQSNSYEDIKLEHVHEAAFLHDIIEDTGVFPNELMHIVKNPITVKIVRDLTRHTFDEDETYFEYIYRIKDMNYPVKQLKYADIHDNLMRVSKSMIDKDPDRAKKMIAKYVRALRILGV
jgi:(p)ppGpp synthase/HD superfamily hydrolase